MFVTATGGMFYVLSYSVRGKSGYFINTFVTEIQLLVKTKTVLPPSRESPKDVHH